MRKTVREVIKELENFPQDVPLFFDCPHCGRANIFSMALVAAVIETELQKENKTNALRSNSKKEQSQ